MPSITTTETVPQEHVNGVKGKLVNQAHDSHKNGIKAHEEGNHKSALEEYADQILENSRTVCEYLRSTEHPQPSFERDAPATTLPDSAPENIQKARTKLMEAALRTFQLALGPKECIPNLAVGFQYITCLRWLTHFNIFSLVPLYGSVAYSELAAAAKVSKKQLKTVARMVMTNNLFYEPEPNHIGHTATSALIASNPSLHDWAVFMSETSAPAAAKLVEASMKWPDSVQKNETAYNVAFDTDLPFFDHLRTQEEKTRQFASYMKNVQNSEGTAIRHLVNGYDWAGLGKATVVDVGGSTGAASIALAQSFPNLNFIVQDLPENAAEGQASLASLPPAIGSRIYFQGHNFFDQQPFNGAQVYLLRMILHDWPASEATTILKNIIRALNRTSRILIMDTVLPRPGSLPSAQERLMRVRDMTMLQAFNSLERDLEDWKDILVAVDPRLSIVRIVQPPGSVMSVLEVAFDE